MDWPLVRLDNLYDIARGGSPRPIKKFITDDPDGINWIKIGDATASEKFIYETKQKIIPEGIQRSRLVKKGDFILSNSMSFGRPYIMATSGCIHDGWLVLSPKDERVDQDFLYYILGSPFVFKQFDLLAAGSTVRNLNIELVSGVKIPLLPISEQKRIVAILDKTFAGISQAVANAEKNLANARKLFESYLNKVFTQKGEGWKERILSDVCDVRDGTHDSPKYKDEGYPLITSKNLKRDGLNFAKVKYISKEDYTKINKRSGVQKGDILFAMIGTIGNPIVVNVEPDFAIKNVALIKPSIKIDGYFLKYYLQSEMVKTRMAKEAKGTTQKFVGLGYLRDFPVSTPVIERQQDIVGKLDALSNETRHLEVIYQQKYLALTELKQSILQKAFTGELTADTELQQANE